MTAPGVNKISGGGMAHIMSSGGGLPILSSVRYDIVNEPKFTAGFVFEFQGGNATIHTMTWNGTAKGRRYWIDTNSTGNFEGLLDSLPGDEAGYISSTSSAL